MLTLDDVEHRLLVGLAFPPQLAEVRKRAFASVVAALARAGAGHAVAGDLALGIRGVTTSRHGLEFAMVAIPVAELAAEGFTVQGETATRQGIKIRLRVVRPAVLARAERFGKLAVLGAADLLRNKIEDACAPGVLPAVRTSKIAEAERLSRELPDALGAEARLSSAAGANDNGMGQGSRQATRGQEIYRLIGKILGFTTLA
jgi:hypothetical protein